MHRRVIAAFDFDDTLITTDSLPDFLRVSFSFRTFVVNSLCFVPDWLRFKAGHITNGQAKERLLKLFVRGMPAAEFERLGTVYAPRIAVLANPDALERLHWHQQQGHEVVIVSASVRDWIEPWARQQGIGRVIATELERKRGILTGKLLGTNCHGPEKARRFREVFPDAAKVEVYAYGDGESDRELFALADHVYEGCFA